MKFRFYSSLKQPQNKGAALVLVLAFVVLLSGLVVAYLSRTSTDRRLAKSSFEDTSADLLARSALDIVVGDFKQEIVDGSTSASPPYTPTSNANVVPMRSGNPGTVPNLIRRSVRSDGLVAPAVPSRASAVNSSTDVSVNGRSVSLDRWNTHYLIPKSDTSNDDSAPVTSFIAPDWVIVSRGGPSVQTGIGIGSSALNNAANDEGGLLDINVAGFPSPTPAPVTYVGRKGVIAFADLTALPTTGSSFVSNTVINRIIGWRNYATVQPTGTFPSFTFTAAATSNFVNYFLDTSRDFRTVATNLSSNRTDQGFITRAELIKLRSDTGAGAATMLQYLGTFSRESNHSTWGNSGTELAGRFPLSRFDLFAITPPNNAAAIQQYFGLNYVPASGPTAEHWRYCGTSGNTLLSAIPSVSGNSQSPDLFPLLKYALPTGTSISEILSIGASLIDQRDQNDDTTWIEFGDPAVPQKAFGVDKNASTEPGAPPPPSTVLVLNRDFRNVGELGYAYKNGSTSLDFRTAGSSDAPLLDLFTYNTATPRSGIVNLNTQNIYVLAAILMGAITTESSSATVPRTAATPAATSIINATTSLPAIGRQDVARLASAVTHSTFTPNEETKETTARALAEVGQTRTWGLIIDVIAQTGRYPPNAASLANFVVEGEKRYWLHVAIDRFTGQIIDQQLEPVYD